MEKIEMRMNPTSISTNEDGKMFCEGLVNGTETWSHEMGIHRKFIEKVKQGVFTRALQKSQRIDFLAEHDATKLLATTENGSLELFEDSEGLKMRAEICPTSYGKDMYELIKSGMVRNMSFGFKVLKDKWEKRSTGLYERTIEDLKLIEVSVVRNPAYAMSGISARNMELVEDVEIPSEVEENKEEVMKETEQVVEEVSEEKQEEQRAYFEPIHDKNDAVNRCLNLITGATEIIQYCGENGSDTAIVPQLQSTIKVVTDYMVSLTEIEPQIETVGEIVAEVVEEIVDSIVDDVRSEEEKPEENQDETRSEEVVKEVVEETTEEAEKQEKVEVEEELEKPAEEEEATEEKTEDFEIKEVVQEEKDEQPSIDLTAYRQKIKEEIVL